MKEKSKWKRKKKIRGKENQVKKIWKESQNE